jgi:hypothetical protein
MLSIPMMLRIYMLQPLVDEALGFHHANARVFSALNRVPFDFMFTLKAVLANYPTRMIVVLSVVCILVFGHAVRTFELTLCAHYESNLLALAESKTEPHKHVMDVCGPESISTVRNYGNVFWNVFVSMTTLGYGDMYPVTLGGRVFMMLAVVAGLCLVSLLVNAVADNLKLSALEANTVEQIRWAKIYTQNRLQAAVLLQAAWRVHQLRKTQKSNCCGALEFAYKSQMHSMNIAMASFTRLKKEERKRRSQRSEMQLYQQVSR